MSGFETVNAMKVMGSRRIKIIVLLLAVAAIVVALFLRPWPYTMDQTKYELIPLEKTGYQSSRVSDVNPSGVAVGWIDYSFEKVEIVKWHPDGNRETIPLPEGVRACPMAINDQGDIAGQFSRVNNPQKDSFFWSSQRGFLPLRVYDSFPVDWSMVISMNRKSQIAGFMQRKNTLYEGAYWFDPEEGLLDIGSLGIPHIRPRGLNDDGMIVGGAEVSGGSFHAFVWTRQNGIQDIHALVDPKATDTEAKAISLNGWILVQADYDKGRSKILLYHPQKGIGASSPFFEYIDGAHPVGRTDRFVFRVVRLPWFYAFGRKELNRNNWVWGLDQKPVLIAPDVLSGKTWEIVDMTDEGLIYGNSEIGDQHGMTGYDAFLLRPIRPAAPAEN